MQPEIRWIFKYLDRYPIIPEMEKAMNLAYEWMGKNHGYKSKNKRIQEFARNAQDPVFYQIFSHIFAACILNRQGLTYQEMIGYIQGKLGCVAVLDRIKCAAELIALAYIADLIQIQKTSDKTMIITTEYTLGELIPGYIKHAPKFSRPEPAAGNPILGCSFKQHNEDCCLDHIDRMNSVPLSLAKEVITHCDEEPKTKPETPEQLEQWENHWLDSLNMYNLVVHKQGNRFYETHSYDTRGRTYCSGYLINYQGTSYKKAIVELADKEVVEL